jgi:hypothetical protein
MGREEPSMDAKAETKPMGRVTRIDEALAGHRLGEKLGGAVEQASPATRDGEAALPAASRRRLAARCGRSVLGHRPAARAREVGHRREALRVQGAPATAEAAAAVNVGGPRPRRPGPAAADAFPDRHRTRVRIGYSPERRMGDMRRGTGVLGAFPDGRSRPSSAAARPRCIAATARRSMDTQPLRAPRAAAYGAFVA